VTAGENALVIGERGSGKTTLMNQALLKMSKQGLLAVSLKALEIGEHFSQQAFVAKLVNEFALPYEKLPRERAKRFARTVATGLSGIGPISVDGLLDVRTASPLEPLRDVLTQLRTKFRAIAVFVDDCDKIEASEIWASLRGIRDRVWELNISLVLSVLPEQAGIITSPPLDQFFPFLVSLHKFGRDDLRDLIERRLHNKNLIVTDSALDELLLRSSGNPRVALTIVRRMLESYAGDTSKVVLDEEDVGRASLIFTNVKSALEQALLSYLATHPETSASDPSLIKEMGVTRSRLVQVLSRLKSQGLVEGKKIGKKVVYCVRAR